MYLFDVLACPRHCKQCNSASGAQCDAGQCMDGFFKDGTTGMCLRMYNTITFMLEYLLL